MNISSELSTQKLAMATVTPPKMEEAAERRPDNEAAEAQTAKAPLADYQATKIDLTA